MADCCIVVCWSTTWRRKIKPVPADLAPYAPGPYWCAACGRAVESAAAFRAWSWCVVCFLPLFPFHCGDPYLGCPACRSALNGDARCHACTCGTYVLDSTAFCERCGARQTVPLAVAQPTLDKEDAS